jgi:hypothetical protein
VGGRRGGSDDGHGGEGNCSRVEERDKVRVGEWVAGECERVSERE